VAVNLQELPNKCRNALKEIEDGKNNEPHFEQLDITPQHQFIRCITEHDLDNERQGFALSSAFQDHDMSVYVIGPGFSSLDIQTLVSSNQNWTTAVKIPAGIFFENAILTKLLIRHDPFTDPKGNRHDNHARVICTKGATVAKTIWKEHQPAL